MEEETATEEAKKEEIGVIRTAFFKLLYLNSKKNSLMDDESFEKMYNFIEQTPIEELKTFYEKNDIKLPTMDIDCIFFGMFKYNPYKTECCLKFFNAFGVNFGDYYLKHPEEYARLLDSTSEANQQEYSLFLDKLGIPKFEGTFKERFRITLTDQLLKRIETIIPKMNQYPESQCHLGELIEVKKYINNINSQKFNKNTIVYINHINSKLDTWDNFFDAKSQASINNVQQNSSQFSQHVQNTQFHQQTVQMDQVIEEFNNQSNQQQFYK